MGCAMVFRKIPSIHEQKKKPFVYLKIFNNDYRSHGLFCIQEENSSLEQSIVQLKQKTRVYTDETDS
ncbi:hypothetical protein SteCoe_5485 [Stentor coeruleus]|uniref:Uncharacterized protein n=1 Tax=Stentor coeruleus TaxID=5963 RepID=A0A1R2CSH7_9CILI|nr:hypothetical protein SteCoe_5485 [Stentor coeruleus]